MMTQRGGYDTLGGSHLIRLALDDCIYELESNEQIIHPALTMLFLQPKPKCYASPNPWYKRIQTRSNH